MVTVKGTGFIDRPSTRCRFGSTESSAEVLSSDAVRCQVPRSELGGNVSVTVSNNGVDFEGGDRVSFLYQNRPEARSVLAMPSMDERSCALSASGAGGPQGRPSGVPAGRRR